MKVQDQQGMSAVELLIGVGLAGIVALVGAEFMKSRNKEVNSMEQNRDMQSLSKLVERRLLSKSGCALLKDKTLNSTIALPRIDKFEERWKSIKKINLSITELKRLTDTSGIAKVTMKMERTANRSVNTDYYLPVNFKANTTTIEDCDSANQRVFHRVWDKLCGDTFGTLTKGMECAEAILKVQEVASKRICDELFYANAPMRGRQCALERLHAGKGCANRVMVGYGENSEIICGDLAIPAPAPVPVCRPNWIPDPSTVCTTSTLAQNDGCGNSRVVPGTRTCLPMKCQARMMTWTVAGKTCDAEVLQMDSGASMVAVDTVNPTKGMATYTCEGGTWSPPASATCLEAARVATAPEIDACSALVDGPCTPPGYKGNLVDSCGCVDGFSVSLECNSEGIVKYYRRSALLGSTNNCL